MNLNLELPAQSAPDKVLFVDTETFNLVNIKDVGGVKYTETAELLLAGFKLNGQYDYYDYQENPEFPVWALEHIRNGGWVCAHNMLFDYLVLKPHIPELKIEQCMDTMAIVASRGLPLGLDKALKELGHEQGKHASGPKLIRKFCLPRKPSKYNSSTRNYPKDFPQDWKDFRDLYLRDDVTGVEWLYFVLGPLTKREQQVWVETQIVNLEGVPIDAPTVHLIQDKLDTFTDEQATEFVRIAGLFPTQRDKILAWCNSQGAKMKNLQAATVEKVIANEKTPEVVRKALSVRALISHASFKKYKAMEETLCSDSTVKGSLMYHVAGTGRFGGRLIQTQNLTRGSINGVEAVERIQNGEFSVELVKSAVRPMIYHPDGFSIVDYSGIEARVVQWVAGDETALQIFRDGKDPYKWMAEKIYGTPYDEVDSKQRFTGKQAILGLGYQMSARKFIMMVEGYGESISMPEAKLAVDTYRATHAKLVRLWRMMIQGAVMALQRSGSRITVNKKVSFMYQDDFLTMRLPSGRNLYYFKPNLEESDWGDIVFSYMSMNEKNQYVRTHTYGGKLVENLVQATARDLLVGAITALLEEDFKIITHVHDEIVCLGMDRLKEMEEIMCHLPDWAEGLPVDVEGITSPRFIKA